ncbi:hypothetical protein GCM10007897_26360 [Sphingobium jiangsuense]|uniref:SnoaL-like domain-containing protein n=1 Tax=Sphingobium jiangsuense TaxID=870476 RepID=A0A7W6BPU3_9SPHN|nr:nuclear transport factor 2 family protein [Sphingobium jiangsuense]MBB3925659.1 hypothetical protein [Sphingobium jiangsuense]GLT01244.1 hypothetical protein GCM10007897_26360 [Sphingobium jiangsuense]
MKVTKLLLACTALGLAGTGGVAQAAPAKPAAQAPASAPAGKRPVISEGQRALDMWLVQNLMSKHEFYHAAGMNLEEVDALWVARNGPNAKTATFGSPMWVMNGIEVIRGAYGEENQRNREKALKAIAEIDPAVKNEPANLGAGHEWVMHTSTTPIIEIAGDGKTAKGIWYSPGVGLMGKFSGGKVGVDATMFFEKYAGDFIKENGEWKIWHLQMAYDFTPGLPKEMVAKVLEALGDKALTGEPAQAMAQAGERADFKLPEGFTRPVYSYPVYSPQRPGILWPPLPEPYYTFGETFSYCNCEQ